MTGNVPEYVLTALQQALQVDPAARTTSVEAFMRSIAPPPSRRVSWHVALGALACAGLAGFASISTQPSAARGAQARPSCSDAALAFHNEFATVTLPALAARWTPLGVAGFAPIATLADRMNNWLRMYLQTCSAPTMQQPPRLACLAARREELVAFVEEAQLGRLQAGSLQRTLPMLGDASDCERPLPGLLASKIPRDPMVRRGAQTLRYEIFRIEDLYEGGEIAAAIAAAESLVPKAAEVAPGIHIEAQYALATAEDLGGNVERATTLFRNVAKLAEQHHHDDVAAQAWLTLVFSDVNRADPARALEYAAYAEAAISRLGNPPLRAAQLAYARGVARVRASDFNGAEADLKLAIDLAQKYVPEFLDRALQGLGVFYDERGDFAQAASLFQAELHHKLAQGPLTVDGANARTNMAHCMAKVGQLNALAESARAIAELERMVAPDHPMLLSAWVARAESQHILGEPTAADRSYARAEAIAQSQFGGHSLQLAVLRLMRAVNLMDINIARAATLGHRTCEQLSYLSAATGAENKECRLLRGEIALRRNQPRSALAHADWVIKNLSLQDITEQGNLGVRAQWLGTQALLALGQRHAAVARMRLAAQWIATATSSDVALAIHLGLAAALQQTAPMEARAHSDAVQRLVEKYPRLQVKLAAHNFTRER